MARRGRPPYPDLLTPRQQEVLTLVREGLSNREIAERLEITPDGAKFHVSEILTKIGVPSREEAARWERDSDATPAARMPTSIPQYRLTRRPATMDVGNVAPPPSAVIRRISTAHQPRHSTRVGQATPPVPLHRKAAA